MTTSTISTKVQQTAEQRIADGDWDQVRYAGLSTMRAEMFDVPSNTAAGTTHRCRYWPNGSWSCDCPSRVPCHHPALAAEKRERMLFARAMQAQFVSYTEGRA